tara:strand:- start:1039 stop:2181 length:1143 start_codon:yes stop_codon:yes gene_type:complete
MRKKDLKNIILEAYTEVLIEQEDKQSYDLDDELEDSRVIFWKDIPDNIKTSLKKYVEYKGRPAPGDPDRDYVDKEYETYYYTTAYNKETGSFKHHIIRLPSFENLYKRYAKILKDIKTLMGRDSVKSDQEAKDLFELIKTNFRKMQSYLRKNHPEQYERFKIRSYAEAVLKEGSKLNNTVGAYLRYEINENLSDLVNEQEPEPEEQPDPKASKETVLEDSTDIMLNKFPTLKNAIIKLQTEDFKEFVESIDWVSPRPTSFRVNLKNGQDYILKWLGDGFQAQIMGKRYYLNKISEYQQALDKLEVLYRQAPLASGGEAGEAGTDVDSADTGGGGDFPGADAGTGAGTDLDAPDAGGGEEGGADLTDEPIDFEEPAEEPEA